MVTPHCEGDWEIESHSVTKRKGKGFARQTAMSVTDQLEAETLGADQHSWKPDASPSRVSRRQSSKAIRTGLEPFGKWFRSIWEMLHSLSLWGESKYSIKGSNESCSEEARHFLTVLDFGTSGSMM